MLPRSQSSGSWGRAFKKLGISSHTSLSHSDWLESRFRTWLSRRDWLVENWFSTWLSCRDWLVESRFHMWLLRSPWLIGWQPILYVTVTPRPGLVEKRLAEKTGLLLPSPARHIQFLESVFNCNLNISQQQLTLLPSHEAGVSSNELPAVEACKVASYCP